MTAADPPRGGDTPITAAGRPTGVVLADFWRWAMADLLDNTTRGVLAEFLVAAALAAIAPTGRAEWDAYDLRTDDGITVEVKSAAYLQSWAQDDSVISFSVAPTLGWHKQTDTYGAVRRRQADVYVFCLLHHRDRATVNPLDTDQWTFYVAPTALLDARLGPQKTIRLAPLLRRVGPYRTDFAGLAAAVRAAAG